MQKARKVKRVKKKRYSVEEKYRYHSSRDRSPAKHGIVFGSPSHCYSAGFADAFHGRNNTGAISSEFGKKSGKAYKLGYQRGADATWAYFYSTGKQPGDIDYK